MSLVLSRHKPFKDGEDEIIGRKGRLRKRDIDGTLATSFAEELRYAVRELSGIFDVSIGYINSILT